tara:strand:- start:3070 stop:3396 length:327 start_codon:yes stop_codon:yes gene_type:complete
LCLVSAKVPPKVVITKVRDDDFAYKRVVEDDIAKAAVKTIKKQAAGDTSFFLFAGLTQSHYPKVTSLEFTNEIRTGPCGDSLLQQGHAVGKIHDAIDNAGIEANTIVI